VRENPKKWGQKIGKSARVTPALHHVHCCNSIKKSGNEKERGKKNIRKGGEGREKKKG